MNFSSWRWISVYILHKTILAIFLGVFWDEIVYGVALAGFIWCAFLGFVFLIEILIPRLCVTCSKDHTDDSVNLIWFVRVHHTMRSLLILDCYGVLLGISEWIFQKPMNYSGFFLGLVFVFPFAGFSIFTISSFFKRSMDYPIENETSGLLINSRV